MSEFEKALRALITEWEDHYDYTPGNPDYASGIDTGYMGAANSLEGFLSGWQGIEAEKK